ncbi:Acyl-CoA dehydrogenase/oxidase domain protein [Polaromonas sp. CG9_12]|nr:Acyl-CoA dehydrogenase/oxidase domain protein [Polaromonas sp. CG9_12]
MRLVNSPDCAPALNEGVPVPFHEQEIARKLHEIIHTGLADLPAPGSGRTLERWQALAQVAAQDLSLAKLFEGHTDALAIRRELNAPPAPPGSSWGMWAAEAPDAKVVFHPNEGVDGGHSVWLDGRKAWCSGARSVSHGLLTVWRNDGTGPFLASVAMHQPGVQLLNEAWPAIGMAASASIDVVFSSARAQLVGQAGAYLARPGFWHGGAGIAACWLGGAQALAYALWQAAAQHGPGERLLLRQIALGKVDLALQHTTALLRETAAWIDAQPTADASVLALRVRLSAEASADQVLAETGRALGAAPFCKDASFARMACDLPVFLRQSHAERDFAALGKRIAAQGPQSWAL